MKKSISKAQSEKQYKKKMHAHIMFWLNIFSMSIIRIYQSSCSWKDIAILKMIFDWRLDSLLVHCENLLKTTNRKVCWNYIIRPFRISTPRRISKIYFTCVLLWQGNCMSLATNESTIKKKMAYPMKWHIFFENKMKTLSLHGLLIHLLKAYKMLD